MISDLSSRFHDLLPALKRGNYNETEVRVQFINPLFEALGWDVSDRAGRGEVKHEDKIAIAGKAKAPDYGFYLDNRRRFFVEAKKPAVNLAADSQPAFQLRRYAWTAKLPLSVLTDFEEFAVYDTRVRPHQGDAPAVARLRYWRYEQYADQWDEIAALFGRDAVLAGSLEQFAAAEGGKKGIATVDADFLGQLNAWRDLLAHAIVARNPTLSGRDLNFAVQQTLDRLIFLRIAEDRAIEPYGRLRDLTTGPGTFDQLLRYFYEADNKYDSGLFHFQHERPGDTPDMVTPRLTLDDKPLKEIIRALYEPISPYEFSVFPADILGQVYEQFLGNVINLETEFLGRNSVSKPRVIIEQKPEVRKAGGVYYTPTYIVEYIVRQTVGRLLAGHTPDPTGPVSRLRVLDPACGSGSFLLGAYQFLLDWHLDGYRQDTKKWSRKRGGTLLQTAAGDYALTLAERKRILLDNLYGVDIDPQAVEVTKLSLLLKVLEGAAAQLGPQAALLGERVLPDLDNNIKCGNSLIGPDFYDRPQPSLLADDDLLRVNAFDWRAEFRGIMSNGGFDAVIGNPPYLNVDDTWGKGDLRLASLKQSFPHIYNDKTDILFYFLARGVELSKGYVGFIVSRAFLEAYKADKLRAYLASKSAIKQIIDFRNYYVFSGVGITTCIITLMPGSQTDMVEGFKLRQDTLPSPALHELLNDPEVFERVEVSQNGFNASPWVLVSPALTRLNFKIDSAGEPLERILFVGQGMQTGRNDVFGKRTQDEITTWGVASGMYYKRATNSDIQRYFIRDRGEYILYPQRASSFKQLPLGVQQHLLAHASELKERAAFQRGNCEWWKYTWPLHESYYDRRRLICPYLATSNRFALDEQREFLSLTDTTVLFENNQPENLLYILGLLNSRLLTFRFRSIGKLKSGGIYEYFWNSISKLPIRRIDPANPTDVAQHDHLVALVQQMLELHRRAAAEANPQMKTMLQRQIDATDGQIDRVVYGLYGLTGEEIGVVEGVG